MRVVVIGAGYVGLVTATVLAELGHHVTCVDRDTAKLETLEQGKIPFHEPGLQHLVRRNTTAGRLDFSGTMGQVHSAAIVYLAVGTPMGPNGETDLSYIRDASLELAPHLKTGTIVVTKSTVPVGTGDMIEDLLQRCLRPSTIVDVVSNPEFLREGTAVQDALRPDRIVIGANSAKAGASVAGLFHGMDCPVIQTTRKSAELIKYTANSFLATRISFANTIARLCDAMGAHADDVMLGAGLDKRVGTAFFKAGLGYGGSCFPKDVASLMFEGHRSGVSMSLLEAVTEVNATQPAVFVEELAQRLGPLAGKTVCVLGLAFKAHTDDVRESRATLLIRELSSRGAIIRTYDPVAIQNAHRALRGVRVAYVGSAMTALKGADAAVVATEWPEFVDLDFEKVAATMSGSLIMDGRNCLDVSRVTSAGLTYFGSGRPDANPLPYQHRSAA